MGRTARVGRLGTAILYLDPNETTFIEYLKIKNVVIHEKEANHSIIDANVIKDKIIAICKDDRDVIEKSKRAFVSFVRSYKEHDLKYIFPFNKLDLGSVANSFFLRSIPRVKEILGRKIENFRPVALGNINAITFKDKNQGKQFEEKQTIIKQKKEEALLRKKESELAPLKVDYKNNKSLRKKVKRENDFEELESLRHETNLVKKLKQGKISVEEFKEKMRAVEGDLFDESDFSLKSILKKKKL